MSENLKRRTRALEKAYGVGDASDAKRWIDWSWGRRVDPEPAGRELACRMIRQVLLELADDD